MRKDLGDREKFRCKKPKKKGNVLTIDHFDAFVRDARRMSWWEGYTVTDHE